MGKNIKKKRRMSRKMADDDEIDILGDFSFNSCFAQNNQGIPSCSNREDTVHPQWLLDSTATNWYDTQSKTNNREKDNRVRKVSENSEYKDTDEVFPIWSEVERELLLREMAKYGRNVRKISETIKTKTEAEIQALIEAEFGVNLDTPIFGLEKLEGHDDVPAVVQEEIVTDDTSLIVTNNRIAKKSYQRKPYKTKSKSAVTRPIVLDGISNIITINPSEILYDDDLAIGSTESIGFDVDSSDIVSKNISKYQRPKLRKRIPGNHRKKVSRNYDKSKPRNSTKDLVKSPQGRQRKDSSVSEDNSKSPKMQIVLGSGQALPVSEGEQVIKIEKKKESDPESDIDIDVDSDKEDKLSARTTDHTSKLVIDEAPVAFPLRKFEPMPRRQKKINLDGGGGYTIMHTESGDLYQIASEPRKERQHRKQPIHLIPCRFYNTDKPAPFTVLVHVSALVSADVHAHTSRAEVMGLLGGPPLPATLAMCPLGGPAPSEAAPPTVRVTMYCPAAAAASRTHCDMDPVSQAAAAERVRRGGGEVRGWHHSHPAFPAAPSALDVRSQRGLQRALERGRPFLALITSPHWPPGRAASTYRCIRVEEDDLESDDIPAAYQLSVRLEPDIKLGELGPLLGELAQIRAASTQDQFAVDMARDICPDARITYLEKCISSISHHMRSAGYEDEDPVITELLQGVRDVFR